MVIQGSLPQRQLLRAHLKIRGANQRTPFKEHPAPEDRKAACIKVKYENAWRNKFHNQQVECGGQERYEGRFWRTQDSDKSYSCVVDFIMKRMMRLTDFK